LRITGAVLTAKAARQLPVISLALVAAKTEHVRQTNTLSSDAIAGTGIAVCTQNITHAR